MDYFDRNQAAFRAEMRIAFGLHRPSALCTITGDPDTPIGPLLDKLREEHPNDYANLSAHIEVERYR